MVTRNRKTIGILYNVSPSWMGGVIYILNAIKILNSLDEEDKPRIILFYRKDLSRFVEEIDYPYIEKVLWNFPSTFTGYLKSFLTGKNQFVNKIINQRDVDALFPVFDFPVSSQNNVQLVSWYADLQHKYYPEFFSFKKRIERNSRLKLILKNSNHLVVSSNTVLDDFRKYFNLPQKIHSHIFHFASVIDSFDFSSFDHLINIHQLPKKYYLVSNQFHKHKNHLIILQALALLKKRGYKPVVAMTGRLPDVNNSNYVKELHEVINENNLEDQVFFLGVIDRQDQLTLMRYAQAVIQPSLFEGWSTVIEDAISLQTPVIASDIEVNCEQLGDWGIYFGTENPLELADILQDYSERKDFDKVIYEPYEERIQRAAKNFISIFQ